MNALDVEITSLRQKRRSPSIAALAAAWVRRHRPFDRRAIRNPAERDLYWARVQQRLAESDATSLMRREDGRPERQTVADQLIG